MKFLGFTSALLAAFVLASCGQKDNEPAKIATPVVDQPEEYVDPRSPVSDARSVGRIYLDGTLKPSERGAIVTALGFLETNPLASADTRLLEIMKLPAGDHRAMLSWLEERVQYILTPRTSSSKIVNVRKNHRFENPGVFPPAFLGEDTVAAKGKLVMANLGVIFYLQDKKKGELRGLLADGIGTVQFTSPRAGVLMIDAGLLGVVPADYPNAVKVFQLSTLLHEARHSDGNRQTTGFLHAKCPESHRYAKQFACDDNLNGPYTIDALATKTMMESCQGCTDEEIGILRMQYLDFENRVLPGATLNWDDAPEGRRL